MTWHLGDLLAFDVESTGVNTTTDRIVTISLVQANATLRTSSTDHWVLNPGIPIPDEAASIHGYTTERIQAEGEDPASVLTGVADRLTGHLAAGLPVVAYNARYDCTLLNCELARHDLAPVPFDRGPIVDPFVIDKHVDKYRSGKRTLTAACTHYQVTLADAHDAAADAIAAARLAWRLGTLPDIQALTLSELHQAQTVWGREQAESLRDYFVNSGKMTRDEADTDVQTGWPVA
jgi:DNA polymerase-3 subunit epsilon